jgi:tetraacyldisaccharide 4'-kinase
LAESRHAAQYLTNYSGRKEPGLLRDRKVAALCGIGNPSAFLTTLRLLGARVVDQKVFPDHFAYQKGEVESLTEWAGQLPSDCWIVTTQKDWVKLRVDELGGRPLWSLRVALEVTSGREGLEAALLGILDDPTRTRGPEAADSESFGKTGKQVLTTQG